MIDAKPSSFLAEFILEQIALQPIDKRIVLLQCLAVETKDRELATACRAQAIELERANKAHHQMLLNLRARSI